MGKSVNENDEQWLSDEELAELGIEISEDETEEGFFQWIEDMIYRVLGPDPEEAAPKS